MYDTEPAEFDLAAVERESEERKALVRLVSSTLVLISVIVRMVLLKWLWARLARGVFKGVVSQNLLPPTISLNQVYGLIWFVGLLIPNEQSDMSETSERIVSLIEKRKV